MKPAGKLAALLFAGAITASVPGCGQAAHSQENTTHASEQPLTVKAETSTQEAMTPPKSFEPLAFPATQPNVTVKLPTLMYHHVGDPPPGADQIRKNLTVSASNLEAQMKYLKEAGYHTVSQRQLFQALFAGAALPPKPVMLTFDDGYRDNYQVALPILRKYGLVATFYIVTDLLGTPEYMNWDQVAELARLEMDVGSHTSDHQDLTTLSRENLKRELVDSAAAISAHLGHPVYWLCYPAGKYNADVKEEALKAGYLLAVTTKPGEQQSSAAPLELLRYRLRNDTQLDAFKQLVE